MLKPFNQLAPTSANLFLSRLSEGLSEDPSQSELPSDFEQFAREYLHIKIIKSTPLKDLWEDEEDDSIMEIVPFEFNAAQRDLLPKLTGRDIILKSRQLGFSTFIQALFFHRNLTKTTSSITISDVGDNTGTLRAIYNRFYEKWPNDKLSKRPRRDRDSSAIVSYPRTDSENVIKTAGSKTAGRSATYSEVHGSEVAFWPDMKNTFNSALGATAPNTFIALETTANGAYGDFFDLCMEALAGKNEWKLHFYAWWWEPKNQLPLGDNEELSYTKEELKAIELATHDGFMLTQEQIKFRRAMEKRHKEKFAQEYAEDPHTAFIATSGGVFDIDKITFLPFAPEPVAGHAYAAGLDWGQDNDYSSLSIADRTANHEVLLMRWNKMSWRSMRAAIMEQLIRYKVRMVRPERNSMGSSQIEELWYSIEAAMAEGQLPGDCELSPFTTGHVNKHELVTFFRNGLEDYGYALLDDPVGKRELRSFQTRQTGTGVYSYGATEGEHDDTIIARMLAYIGMMSWE